MDMDNKMTGAAKLCNKIKKTFLELKGYRIEVSKNSLFYLKMNKII